MSRRIILPAVALVVALAGVVAWRMAADGGEGDNGLSRFYGQRPTWRECGRSGKAVVECAELTVPLDYDRPDGATLDLAVRRVRAPRVDPLGTLVVDPGAPAASGAEFASLAGMAFPRGVRQHFDLVGLDRRGTGGSRPLTCVGKVRLDELRGPVLGTRADVAAVRAERSRRVLSACADQAGDLLPFLGSEVAARDLDVLRSALGEARLNLYARGEASARVLDYAGRFADRVGRVVLDSPDDPTLDPVTHARQRAAAYEATLTRYVRRCTANRRCYLGGKERLAVSRVGLFLARLDSQPVVVGRRLLARADATAALRAALAAPGRPKWDTVSTILANAMFSNGGPMLGYADLVNGRGARGRYANSRLSTGLAISCADGGPRPSPAQAAAQVPGFVSASKTFGEEAALGLSACTGADWGRRWKAPTVPALATPVLVLASSHDPQMPAAWAHHVARLVRGEVLLRTGDGHGAFNTGSRCVDAAVAGYLAAGTLPEKAC